MKFRSIRIEAWKQFEHIDIKFHSSVTILTGANGSGKTTILNLLGRHFGWNRPEVATPTKTPSGGYKWLNWLRDKIGSDKNRKIGEIHYSEGFAELRVPTENQAEYQIEFKGTTKIDGLNIPSHRAIYAYQQVPHISTTKRSRKDAFQISKNSTQKRFQLGQVIQQHPNFHIKETLLSWAVGGAGNEFISPDPQLYGYYKDFETILRNVLPESLGFKRIAIRSYEIVLETQSGDFLIDAVSGGISAVIDLVWQIYTCSEDNEGDLVVLIDEVENHLHPSMQRRILPDLVLAFPNIQFIVTTHSPLVVGSVKNSRVYALSYNPDKFVVSQELDLINKSKTASEILTDVLGVPITMPIWAEIEMTRILSFNRNSLPPEEYIAKIRRDLITAGLGEYFPEAIIRASKDWQ